MLDSDDMKSQLLQDLIQQVLEMKDKPSEEESGADKAADELSALGADKGSGESPLGDDPKAKLTIMDIKAKPEGEPDGDEDMHSPVDFAALRRKHEMGL